jgi:hypothetical protein
MGQSTFISIFLTITGAILYECRHLREEALNKAIQRKGNDSSNIDHHRRMSRRRASASVNA